VSLSAQDDRRRLSHSELVRLRQKGDALPSTRAVFDIICLIIHKLRMASTQSPGRPRSFDADKALRAAMEAFWASGYTATSYDELETATQLRRQSLIYAFGDKRSLFLKAMSLYTRERVDEIIALLERDASPLANVEAVLSSWLEDIRDGHVRGCLMVNTSGELGRSEPQVADIIASATRRLRQAFALAFKTSQAIGELDARHDAEDLATLAVAAGDGALLHARIAGEPADAVRAFKAFVRLLQ
jgi:TetR/AcrR family transcriptional regulator, transcriptional repressor for nem operon